MHCMPRGSHQNHHDLDVDCLIHKYVDDTTLTESLYVQHQLPSYMEFYF